LPPLGILASPGHPHLAWAASPPLGSLSSPGHPPLGFLVFCRQRLLGEPIHLRYEGTTRRKDRNMLSYEITYNISIFIA
jgi:hypothetical protein